MTEDNWLSFPTEADAKAFMQEVRELALAGRDPIEAVLLLMRKKHELQVAARERRRRLVIPAELRKAVEDELAPYRARYGITSAMRGVDPQRIDVTKTPTTQRLTISPHPYSMGVCGECLDEYMRERGYEEHAR